MTIETRKIASLVLIVGALFLLLNLLFGLGYDGLSWIVFAAAWLVATILWKRGDNV